MLIIDGHLDLAWNALNWNRDLKRTVAETRAMEVGMTQKGRAAGTVAFPEMRKGEIAVTFPSSRSESTARVSVACRSPRLAPSAM